MKKLLSLLSVLTISGTAPLLESSCSVSNKKNKNKNNNENDINKLNWGNLGIEKINRVKRNTINNKSQHIFKTNNELNKPTEQQIKEVIIALNPQLDTKNINVTNITENSAVITIANFSGPKTIHFKVETNTSNNDEPYDEPYDDEPYFISSPSPNTSYDVFSFKFKIEKIDPPNQIVAKDIKNVTEKEIIDALLPKIYEEYDRINPQLKIKNKYDKYVYGAKDYLKYNHVKIKNINFPIDLSSDKIIDNFSIEGTFIYRLFPFLEPVFDLKISNFKLPAAKYRS